MDDLRDALARLDASLLSLERRVSAIEQKFQQQPASSSAPAAVVAATPAPAPQELAVSQAAGAFSIVGKAMLGIAGAYVLRAVAESGSFPKLAVVVLALLYAGTWLVWATRVPVGALFARFAYAATAALILAPMLGELTLRFQVLSSGVTAILLSGFVLGAAALAWKGDLTCVVWVATATAIVTAFPLLIASRDLAPYIAALLVICLVSEAVAARNRWRGLRLLAAPAADLAVLILVYIYSLPERSRVDYAAVAAFTLLVLPCLLFFIYGASIAGRTGWLRQKMTIFDIVQAVVAFLLAALSCLLFAPVAGRIGLGVFCGLLSAVCYAVAFAYFDRIAEPRNYHVYSTWAVALVLAGSFLVLPRLPLVSFLSVAAVVSILVGVRMSRLTPEFHGLVYLAAAASASGLLEYAARALTGTFPAAPGWIVWVVAVSAVLCYAIGGRFEGERWNERLLRLLAAILAVSAAATFLVSCLVWLAAIGMTPGESYVAVIRTLITSILALALAFGGSRWHRVELVWTGYGTLAFVTAKLLFEDLPHGHSGSIAISIFLYAVTLIIMPRVASTARRQS